ncbi:DNA-methyltransferase [Staphylococcus haemolyticus]|uniref:DNA-methyltransferase n=1 Tax=Staphylococcus haemolyticus TaxID=1283 RepID=UPI0015D855A7|nr:site-specific DNA-methyltransferase [Staphylococcus haemolyticus]
MELNKIYNEDCLVGMRNIEENSIDLTVTSPPYDNLREYNGFNFDFENTAKEIYRITKSGGVLVWVVNDSTVKGSESGISFKQALYFKSIGFRLHDTMIFAKNNPLPLTHNRYEQQFEYMFVFSKGKPKTFNPIKKANKNYGKVKTGTHRKNKKDLVKMTGSNKSVKKESIKNNIWYYSVNRGAISKDLSVHKHPAAFPEEMAIDHIKSWSNKGDLVLDPFIGSGTTAIACIKTKRNFIGFDVSEEYCELSKLRIENILNSDI